MWIRIRVWVELWRFRLRPPPWRRSQVGRGGGGYGGERVLHPYTGCKLLTPTPQERMELLPPDSPPS